LRDDTFTSFVLDQLAGLGDVRAKAMFGGHGLYRGETFFGIVYKGRLYFRVDDVARQEYVERGMKPFRPSSRQTLGTYYEVPVQVLEDPAELSRWARRATSGQSSDE